MASKKAKIARPLTNNVYVWAGGPPTWEDMSWAPDLTIFPGYRGPGVQGPSVPSPDLWDVFDIGDSEIFEYMTRSGIGKTLYQAGIIDRPAEDRWSLAEQLGYEAQYDYDANLDWDSFPNDPAPLAVASGWTLIKIYTGVWGGAGGHPVASTVLAVLDKHDKKTNRWTPSRFSEAARWLLAVDAYVHGDDEALVMSDLLQARGVAQGTPTQWLSDGNFEALDAFSRALWDRTTAVRPNPKRRLMR